MCREQCWDQGACSGVGQACPGGSGRVCFVAQEFSREDSTLQPRPGQRVGVHQATSEKEGIPGTGTRVSRNPMAFEELLMTSCG